MTEWEYLGCDLRGNGWGVMLKTPYHKGLQFWNLVSLRQAITSRQGADLDEGLAVLQEAEVDLSGPCAKLYDANA